jgi:hypothetical protein
MSDLVMDYALLNQAAQDITNLSPQITKIKNAVHSEYRGGSVETVPGLVNENNTDLGPGETLYRALGAFYGSWGTDMSNAMDALDKLAGYFSGVADSFMETDASQAAGLNESAALSAIMRYPAAMDQYNQELAADQKAGKAAPPLPVAPSSPFSLTAGGPVTTYTTQTDTAIPAADKSTSTTNVVFASETTTDTSGGLTYSETTTFAVDQGWGSNGGPTQNTTQVINNPDGSTDTITTTTDTGGAGSMTDVNSSSGTTTYTRANWGSNWVDTTPPPSSDGSDSSNGVDAAPFVD